MTYRERGDRIADQEHFGFRDGISQPGVEGSDTGGPTMPCHFVFGQPKISEGQPVTVGNDPEGIGLNGSLLVLRRLKQDVSPDLGVDSGPSSYDNAFDFAADPNGRGCPFAARIRKVYPRRGPRDSSTFPGSSAAASPSAPATTTRRKLTAACSSSPTGPPSGTASSSSPPTG